MSDSFLEMFEKRRLEIEGRALRMPEASQIMVRYGAAGESYLHALPTVTTLIDIMARSPRTTGAFRDRVERAGPTRIRDHETARAFACFGLAYLYKHTAAASGFPEMANLLTRVAVLSMLTPRELEKIDFVLKSFNHRGRDGRRDRLAPANLLLAWLSGVESPTRAYEADYFLELYSEFVRQALEHALRNEIFMNFPW